MDVHLSRVQQITDVIDVPRTADLVQITGSTYVQQILHVAESTVCDARQNQDRHAKYWFFCLSPATAALLCTLVVCCALAWLYGVTPTSPDPTPEMITPDHRVSSGRSEPGSPPPGPTKSSVSFSNDGGRHGPQGHARALAAEFNQVKRNRNGRPDTSPRRVLPSAVRSAI
ncbi:MAG: hypothetical protein ACKVI4_17240 [Actinomycetales bacterium]